MSALNILENLIQQKSYKVLNTIMKKLLKFAKSSLLKTFLTSEGVIFLQHYDSN